MNVQGIDIERLTVSVYQVPTERPRSDATRKWDHTTIVVVEAHAGGTVGLGYTYADSAAALFIRDVLGDVVAGRDALAVAAAHAAMQQAIREAGRPGIAESALSAVDVALWDLKAHLLEVPLVLLLGAHRKSVPVYGSGGFTSESIPQLREQLQQWVAKGIRRVKMKVGRLPEDDRARVAAARDTVGLGVELYVDANGGYTRKEALKRADEFAALDVTWFEEPVSSDDLDGLRLIRDRAPAGVEIAAGEYGYDRFYFRRMLAAGAVDVLQVDARRCGGVTGFCEAASLARAFGIPVSSHTAPALHAHVCCAVPGVRHVEYFSEHVRVEGMLFDGVPSAVNGMLTPDLSAPGLGLALRRADAQRHAV
ncbi:mandelate racemase [Nitrospira sp.]|nr:mandelate racemase [Nitrospira sp.]